MADALFALARVVLARDNVIVAANYGHNCLTLMEAANPRRSNEVRQWLDKVQLSKGSDS